MRLLDRILSGELSFGHQGADRVLEALLSFPGGPQLVVIDNVAEYFSEQMDRTKDEITINDFPCVTPPFPSIFFDFRIKQSSKLLYEGFEEGGLWMRMMSREDLLATSLEEERVNFLLHSNEATALLMCYVYLRSRYSHIVAEVAGFTLPITKEGTIVPFEDSERVGMGMNLFEPELLFAAKDEKVQREIMGALAHSVVYPSLLALSFMHCKNVKTREEFPPPKLSKIHQKKTGRPLLRYYTLVIDHVKTTLAREGKIGEAGLKKALHICRGHFHSYGQDGNTGLLFGKITGRFFIPMHSRGNAKRGIVLKDYEVK
jgi:hypothetical protein